MNNAVCYGLSYILLYNLNLCQPLRSVVNKLSFPDTCLDPPSVAALCPDQRWVGLGDIRLEQVQRGAEGIDRAGDIGLVHHGGDIVFAARCRI